MEDRKQAIWLVSNTSWYIYNFRANLIAALIARGHSVVALAPEDSYSAKLVALGARFIHLPLDNAGTNPFKDGSLILRLIRLFKKEQPGLLLTFTPKVNIYCSLAARRMGIPTIVNVSGLGSGFLRGGWLSFVMKSLYRLSFRNVDCVFFQNDDDRRLFIDHGLVNPAQTDRLPGSGVDVEKFVSPTRIRDTNSPTVFLMVARLLGDKGVREFVDAARSIRRTGANAVFKLVGALECLNITSISRDEVSGWQREGVLEYTEHTDDIKSHYADADCIVLPSYREGTSRVLLEGASMSLPIITTDVTGCREVVDNGVNGLLCRPRDAADLAEKMLQMLAFAPDKRREMGRAGRDKVLRLFDERRVIRQYLERIDLIRHAAGSGSALVAGNVAEASRSN